MTRVLMMPCMALIMAACSGSESSARPEPTAQAEPTATETVEASPTEPTVLEPLLYVVHGDSDANEFPPVDGSFELLERPEWDDRGQVVAQVTDWVMES